ncbi:SdiA-regulated family protein [Niabella insulamsoli]|uniref:SdiA-regulated family protein n=1 Tax=Niabella insulamsoli TaxID=3144874 RepID=UPI0031FDFCC3
MTLKPFIIMQLLLLLSFAACNQVPEKQYEFPQGYNLNEPEKFEMEDPLLEISGISFANNDSLFAIQDEQGRMFYGVPGNPMEQQVKFSKGGDFEDISIMEQMVFVLKSNGSVYSFPLADRSSEELTSTREWKKMIPKGEYESLFANSENQLVYILCKTCKADKKEPLVKGYALKWQHHNLQLDHEFSLKIAPIEAMLSDKKETIRPSAITFDPHTKQWFIIASINKLLIIADVDWNATQAYNLDPKIYRQPEGIAFDSKRNLYISNEGDVDKPGNVLKISFRP